MNKSENNKPLKSVPKGFHYLKIYCHQCHSLVTNCKESKKGTIESCPFGHKLRYKVVVNIPGEKEARKTYTLTTRNLATAMQQTMSKVSEVKEGDQNSITKISVPTVIQAKPQTLDAALARYIGYLNNDKEIVPEHKVKIRSKKHIKEVIKFIKYLKVSQRSHIDTANLPVGDFDQIGVGKYHKYIESLGLSNRSYNKGMSVMSTFYNYLISEGYKIGNPFKSVRRKQATTKIETLNGDEYPLIRKIIQNEELGKCKLKDGKVRSYYKPWNIDGTDLGFYTGRRTNEIVNMRWNNIIKDEKGNLLYIETEDLKFNRQKGNDSENLKYVYVPITQELREVLYRIGYEKYKNSDKYILAPEEKMTRDSIKFFISKSFTHYVKQLNLGKKVTYKTFRKNYISRLSSLIGIDNARIITGHSGIQVMQDHYVDSRMIAKTARELTMFDDKTTERTDEIDVIRKSNSNKTIER